MRSLVEAALERRELDRERELYISKPSALEHYCTEVKLGRPRVGEKRRRWVGTKDLRYTSQGTKRILALVPSWPETVTTAEVASALGLTSDHAAQSLARLTKRGIIRRVRTGVYSMVSSSAQK